MRLAPLAAGLFLAFAGSAFAQSFTEPADLLEAFYKPYFDGSFPDDESQFRSTELQALYDNDAETTPEGEMGALSFDPYVDGQDFEITDFEIGAAGIAGDYSSADVTFKNFGESRSLMFEMVREDGGWKIDDVVSNNPDNPYRLSEIFAEAAGEVE
ncbi:DUF3828 domain-containing protein [Devosia psychrophila]|jgi:hypothetical protein|uniref:DUF3828 domain-containing protein n=1 Tax=Devosia psychrophila TaxID=728005 RepID=A0A1I1MZP8_9HYPH|nr:DUF3828 domain-containing protein [Devosia psychrophila]SFC87020.1 Protein of unknown function [Devosia psychrophila]